MASGGKTKTDNSIDPWSRAQYDRLSGNVQSIMNANPFQSYQGERVAGLTDLEREAADFYRSNMGAGTGTLNEAVDAARAAGGYQPTMLDESLDSYLNPYTDQVVDATLADLDRSRQMAIQQGQASATAAGAFGGSRHGVADSLTNAEAMRAAATAGANLRSGAYESAAERAQRAALANQAAGLSGAQLNMQGAGLLGDLGQAQSGNALREALGLAAFGETQRGLDQAGLDVAYQEFLRGQEDPYRRAQVQLGLLGSTPMIQDSTTRQSPGLLGTIGGIAQIGGSLFGTGGPFGGGS